MIYTDVFNNKDRGGDKQGVIGSYGVRVRFSGQECRVEGNMQGVIGFFPHLLHSSVHVPEQNALWNNTPHALSDRSHAGQTDGALPSF